MARDEPDLRPHWLLVLIGLVLLAVVLHSAPLAETWAVLRRLGPGQLGLLAGANALALLTFSGRWWLILRAQGQRIPYPGLVGYRLAAFGVSYFTPGPQFGGEPLQVYLTNRRDGVPPAVAVAAVALDKTLELLVNFTFLAAGLAVVLALQGPRAARAAAGGCAIPGHRGGGAAAGAARGGAERAVGRPPSASAPVWRAGWPLPRGRRLARLAGVLREAEAQVAVFAGGRRGRWPRRWRFPWSVGLHWSASIGWRWLLGVRPASGRWSPR